MQKIKFIPDEPALVLDKPRTLVIADLHLGFEWELYQSGIVLPSQTEKLKNKILELIEKTDSERLIILGDVKHKVPGISFQELREIPKMLNELKAKVEVIICQGNHDDQPKQFVPEGIKVYGTKGFIEDKIAFNHGHTWPKKELLKADTLILAHNHPLVELRDKLGFRMIEPCWVRSEIDKAKIKQKYKLKATGELKVIVMPAFNELVGGVIFNSQEILGPLFKNQMIKIEESALYLLDGTLLGKIENLRKFAGVAEPG